jgi:GTP pyrophosphokinase
MEVDANDRDGLLQDIMTVIQKADLKLTAISARALQEKIAIINFTIIVKNIEEITKTIRDIKKIDSVYDVKRKK